ncbi:MAG: HIT domain-containing protein [Candidatus Nomurabacteria bacterium]|nr:HIT domain-containing protein [Candidatus Nomurabacteria bacterium]
MQDSIFTRIIKGEIPAHRIYEDDKTLAFLDIFPKSHGHSLVVPKIQIDRFYDLPDEDYTALFATVKKMAAHMEKVFGRRTIVKIIGTDVPHAHVHLFPYDPNYVGGREPSRADDAELAKLAEKLRFVEPDQDVL